MEESQTVFALCFGDDNEKLPIAAFSKLEVAETAAKRINRYVELGVDILEIPLSTCTIEVDKYEEKVNAGKSPYTISLHRDGYLFEHWDLISHNLDEPILEEQEEHLIQMRKAELLNPKKQWGIGGTYWAANVDEAINSAQNQRVLLFKKHKVPLIREVD